MTRTTISLHESVFAKVKDLSQKEHATLGETITELLNLGLDSKKVQVKKQKGKFALRTFSLGKTKVPLEDKETINTILYEKDQ